MLLLELSCDSVGEIWSYLEIKDIIQLFKTSIDIKDLSHRMNNIVAANIKVREDLFRVDIDETEYAEVIAKIIKSFPKISKLILNETSVTFGNSLFMLYDCSSICESLKELKVRVSDGGLIGISNLKNLHTLDLEGSEISDSFYNKYHLRNLTNLKSLDLSSTSGFLDEFFCISSSARNLTHLNLSYCSINNPHGLVFLICFLKLEYLDLKAIFYPSVNDNGRCYHTIAFLKNLTYLNVSQYEDDGYSDEEHEYQDLSYLKSLTNLTFLNLSNSYFIDTELIHISQLLNLTSLIISWFMVSDDGMSHLSYLTNLTQLDIEGCDITNAGLSHLSLLTNLTSLDLAYCIEFADFSLTLLFTLTKLETLSLQRSVKFSSAEFIHLSKLTSLTSLNISNCKGISNSRLKQLSNLKNLTILALSCCNKITNDGLKFLIKLPNLTLLIITRCSKITYGVLHYLKKFTSLIEVAITKGDIDVKIILDDLSEE